MFRAGAKIAVSSRAFGEFKGKVNGVDNVDEDSYDFNTFDFVRTPGVSIAYPTLVESKTDDTLVLSVSKEIEPEPLPIAEVREQKSETLNEVIKMSENTNTDAADLLKKVYEEKSTLMVQIKELISDNDELKAKQILMEENNTLLKSQVAQYENLGSVEELATIITKVEHLNESISSLTHELDEHKKLGSIEDVTEAKKYIVDITEELKAYKDVGSVEDFVECKATLAEHAKHLEDLGDFDQITEAFDRSTERLAMYRELGTVEELTEALDKATDLYTKYKDLGTPEEIAETFNQFEEYLTELKQQKIDEETAEFASKFFLDKETANELITAHGKSKAAQIVESLKSNRVSTRYSISEDKKDKEVGEASVVLTKTRLQKLNESFAK